MWEDIADSVTWTLPIHVHDLWEFQFLVYLLGASKLGIKLKSRQFKGQHGWQLWKPSLKKIAHIIEIEIEMQP